MRNSVRTPLKYLLNLHTNLIYLSQLSNLFLIQENVFLSSETLEKY